MKTRNLFILPALILCIGLIWAGHAAAQTFTNLHSFAGTPTDGLQPTSGLVLSGNVLYGTTDGGGSSSNGAVFAIHTDGSGYTNLYSFTAAKTNSSGIFTNSDGANPGGGQAPGGRLVLSGNILYGTAFNGGTGGAGTVFKVQTDGSGFTNLHNFTAFNAHVSIFTNSDGANPADNLILSGNTLYGTALYGGAGADGTVFALNTDGTGFTNLHTFSAQLPNTNGDGAYPLGGLILLGNIIYGTADSGGTDGGGTVFAVNTAGTVFTNLHSFTAPSSAINSNGFSPDGGLVLSGNTLYGTTSAGGVFQGGGTVFKINTDGTGFTNLHSFLAASANASGFYTNSEGLDLFTSLIISGNTLYGTAFGGGTGDDGTVFALNTDGTGFTTLYSFTEASTNASGFYTNSDGAFPYGSLTISGNILYGTTTSGGIYGNFYSGGNGEGVGTLFSLTLPSPPQLTIIHTAASVILTWPTNAAGLAFTLQSTRNLVSPPPWSNVSPSAVVVNGQNVVTNPASGTQKFYRLSQ